MLSVRIYNSMNLINYVYLFCKFYVIDKLYIGPGLPKYYGELHGTRDQLKRLVNIRRLLLTTLELKNSCKRPYSLHVF